MAREPDNDANAEIRALFERYSGGKSARSIAVSAGLNPRKFRWFLDKNKQIREMPDRETIDLISQTWGCSVEEVVDAFRIDLNLPGPATLSGEEHELLKSFREMDQGDRRRLLSIAQVLVQSDAMMSSRG